MALFAAALALGAPAAAPTTRDGNCLRVAHTDAALRERERSASLKRRDGGVQPGSRGADASGLQFEASRVFFVGSQIARSGRRAAARIARSSGDVRTLRCAAGGEDPPKERKGEDLELPEQIQEAAKAVANALFGKLQTQLDSYSASQEAGGDSSSGQQPSGSRAPGAKPAATWGPLAGLPQLLDVSRWLRWASVGAGSVVGLVVAAAVLPIQKFLLLLAALAAAAAVGFGLSGLLRRRSRERAQKAQASSGAAPGGGAAAWAAWAAPPKPQAGPQEAPRGKRRQPPQRPPEAAHAEQQRQQQAPRAGGEGAGKERERRAAERAAGGSSEGPQPALVEAREAVRELREAAEALARLAGPEGEEAAAAREGVRAAGRLEAALEAGAVRVVCFGEGGPTAARRVAELLAGPAAERTDAMRAVQLEGVRRAVLVAPSAGLGGDRAAEAVAREAAAAAELVLFPCEAAPLGPAAARALRALAGGLRKRCLLVAVPGGGAAGEAGLEALRAGAWGLAGVRCPPLDVLPGEAGALRVRLAQLAAEEGPELLAENALYGSYRASRALLPRLAAARRRAAEAAVESYQWRVAGGVAVTPVAGADAAVGVLLAAKMAEEVAAAYGQALDPQRARELAESLAEAAGRLDLAGGTGAAVAAAVSAVCIAGSLGGGLLLGKGLQALTSGLLARLAGLALVDYFEQGGWGEGGPEAALRRHLDLAGRERAVQDFVRQAWERVFLPALPAARDAPNPFAPPPGPR